MRKLTLNGLMRANDKLIRARQLIEKVQPGQWTPFLEVAVRAINDANNVVAFDLDDALRERRIQEAAKHVFDGPDFAR